MEGFISSSSLEATTFWGFSKMIALKALPPIDYTVKLTETSLWHR
jgi:hypothetical protein